MKRIAFLISDQHLIPHGGIGQFCKSFTEMATDLGYTVDILCDQQPKEQFAYDLKSDNVNLYYNSKPLSYSTYNILYLYRKGINLERIVNFQSIVATALELHKYDFMLVNGDEALAAVFPMKLDCKVMFYTHYYRNIHPEVKMRDNFISGYHEYFESFLYSMKHITVGTQTEYNRDKMKKNGIVADCKYLPMPIPERDLLVRNDDERKGVLFIGRWEDGKNPQAYIEMIRQTKLPAKVLTNMNGAKKFEAAFKKIGHTDYEIKFKIVGEEKNNFIKSSKVAFIPSLFENYCFACFETIGHMPVVVLEGQSWINNFDERFYAKTSVDNMANTVLEQYKVDIKDRYDRGSLDYVKTLDEQAPKLWKEFIEGVNK